MKTLFDTTKINAREIRNRFFVAPMTRVSADLAGIPTSAMEKYYTAFASGGFGGIITEGLFTDDLFSRSYPNQPGIINKDQVDHWKPITTQVHRYDTLFIAQLMHAGSISQNLKKTKAPSAIVPLGKKLPHYGGGSGPFPIPEEMTKEDIDDVVKGFVNAAQNALSAGFDGIELHAANGYLLDQFITPYLNLRKDEYGGTIENRTRIIAQIVTIIKQLMPENFIVGLRISEGKVNNLSYRWEEGKRFALALLHEIKKLPIDYIHIAAEHWGWEQETLYDDGTSLSGLAKEILNIPVIANGKLHDVQLSQRLLETDQADFFAIGKYALANPDLVNKIINNEELIPFEANSLFPNPSLFPDHTYEKFLEPFKNDLEIPV